jgi:lipid II:glycine glycyltransferase (peptidoglycan interpeptide bridge formation enzyme)
METSIVGPDEFTRICESLNKQSLYQSVSWQKIICESFNASSIFVVTKNSDREVILATPFTWKRKGIFKFIGAPLRGTHTEFVGTLFANNLSISNQLAAFRSQHDLLVKSGFDYIEWAFQEPPSVKFDTELTRIGYASDRKNSIEVNLEGDIDEIWDNLTGRARNMIRKAKKLEVSVERLQPSLDLISQFYEILSHRFKQQGQETRHPKEFYELICSSLFQIGQLDFLVAKHKGSNVAFGIFLNFQSRTVFLSGCSTHCGNTVAAPSLIQWRAIQLSKERSDAKFDFGGTGQPAIDKFKRSFGGTDCFVQRWVYRSVPIKVLLPVTMKLVNIFGYTIRV